MENLPWKHIITTTVAFIVGYGMTQIAEGYNYVAFHFSWQAVLQGAIMSGLYTGGLVQNPPTKTP
jgi:hypothetical protein